MRSRNSLIRERREAYRDARLIVIASEGKDTERLYFKALAKESFWSLAANTRNTCLHIGRECNEQKLAHQHLKFSNSDEAIQQLKSVDVNSLGLEEIEKYFVMNVQMYI